MSFVSHFCSAPEHRPVHCGSWCFPFLTAQRLKGAAGTHGATRGAGHQGVLLFLTGYY